MIEQIDQQIENWIVTVLGTVPLLRSSPNGTEKAEGIGLYLFEVLPTPVAREVKRAGARKFTLRYLITAWASEPAVAHRWLGTLMWAALDAKEFELEPEPLPLDFWIALGVAPRPNLCVRAPLVHRPAEKIAPLVRSPMVVQTSPVRTLRGRILGPGGIGVMGARIELPSVRLSARTDAQGRFEFTAVPADPPLKQVKIQARGKESYRNAQEAIERGQPLLIQLEESEV